MLNLNVIITSSGTTPKFNYVSFLYREDYDIALNQICVTVHFSSHYTVKDGVLVSKQVG